LKTGFERKIFSDVVELKSAISMAKAEDQDLPSWGQSSRCTQGPLTGRDHCEWTIFSLRRARLFRRDRGYGTPIECRPLLNTGHS